MARALQGADAAVNLCGILFQSGQTFEDCRPMAPPMSPRRPAPPAWARWCMSRPWAPTANRIPEYAVTKAEGEEAVREAFPKAVILRPSIIFGPEDGFFNKFAALARFMPALPLIGGGHTRFQPVFVGDVAQAIVTGLSRQDGRTYELGGPAVYSFKELLQLILRETGRRRILVPLPFGLAMLKAAFLQILPKPLLTMDQVRLLEERQCGLAHRAGPGGAGHLGRPRSKRWCRPICGVSTPRENMPARRSAARPIVLSE